MIIGATAGMVMCLVPMWYFTAYRMARSPKWSQGRGLSTSIQGGVVGFAVLFVLVYFVLPAMSTDIAWHAMISSAFGALLLLSGLGALATRKFSGSVGRAYMDYLIRASLVASLAQLSYTVHAFLPSIFYWRWEYPLGFAAAIANLVGCEIEFLKRNKGVLAPNDPK